MPHESPCTTRAQLSGLALGVTHNVSVKAVRDPICPWETPAALVAWFEPDIGPGVPTVTQAPAGAVFSSFASFEFDTTAAPGTTTFEYTRDGSSWSPCGSALKMGPLVAGPHSLVVRTSDGVSVSENRSVSWTVLAQSSYQLQVCYRTSSWCECAWLRGPAPFLPARSLATVIEVVVLLCLVDPVMCGGGW
jgi:hypothetical protein